MQIKHLFIAVLFVALTIAGLSLVGYAGLGLYEQYQQPSPEETAQAYDRALAKGDVAALKRLQAESGNARINEVHQGMTLLMRAAVNKEP